MIYTYICCSDASYIPLHPQHLHQSMTDWRMRYRQIDETTNQKGVANDVLPEEESVFIDLISHLTNTGTNGVDFCV